MTGHTLADGVVLIGKMELSKAEKNVSGAPQVHKSGKCVWQIIGYSVFMLTNVSIGVLRMQMINKCFSRFLCD